MRKERNSVQRRSVSEHEDERAQRREHASEERRRGRVTVMRKEPAFHAQQATRANR